MNETTSAWLEVAATEKGVAGDETVKSEALAPAKVTDEIFKAVKPIFSTVKFTLVGVPTAELKIEVVPPDKIEVELKN